MSKLSRFEKWFLGLIVLTGTAMVVEDARSTYVPSSLPVMPSRWEYPGERVYHQFRAEPDPPNCDELTALLLDHWTGRTYDESSLNAEMRLKRAAWGIAAAIEIEWPLFEMTDYEHVDTQFATAKLKTGYWLIALADSEMKSEWPLWVKDGRCNLFEWRQKNGDKWCDSGAAFGYWQMHVDEQHRPGDPTGAELLADDTLAAVTAIRWLRDTPTAWGSYAVQRARAEAWYRKAHP